jgi:Ion transport protein
VVQVRNKLWRAVLKHTLTQTTATRPHDNIVLHALKKYVHRMLMDEASSGLAAVVAIFIKFAIISSSLAYIYETLPEYRMRVHLTPAAWGPRGVHAVNTACSILFIIELILQAFSAPSVSVLVTSTSFVINLLALIPWITQTAGAPQQSLVHALKLLRVMRILTMIRSSKRLLKLIQTTFRRAANMLVLLSCIISMIICMLALLLWTVERGEWDPATRMFWRTNGWNCPVVCTGPARFGSFAGCSAAGDEVWMTSRDKIGRQQHRCIPVQVGIGQIQPMAP